MTLKKENIKDIYRVSPMQEGMFFHWLYDKSSLNYFEQTHFRLRQELNIHLVEKSLNELVKRYDILRTVFTQKIENKILQVVLKERNIDFYYEDISAKEDKKTYFTQYKEMDKKRSFDLTRDVLMRVALFQSDVADYEFIWSFHHIIMDGWCSGILISEFYEIYNSYLENRPYKLLQVKPYRVFIDWIERQDKSRSRDYWREYLAGYEAKTSIPRLVPSKLIESKYKNENKKVIFTINDQKTAKLNLLAGRYNVTLSMVCQAVWGIILGKYNNTTDVVFGSVVSGRPPEIEGVESILGLFINTIPVRIKYKKEMPFNGLLKESRERDIECKPHHYYPLVEIQNESALKQNLLDHLLVVENYPFDSILKDVKFEFSDVEGFDQTNYDFTFTVIPGDQLKGLLEYNGNVYEEKIVENAANHLIHIIDQILSDETKKIESFELLTKKEKEEILFTFNNTNTDYPKDKPFQQLFEEQLATFPGKTAVIFEDFHLTYVELNRRSNRLARRLRTMGVQMDEPVGILMERSLTMIESILSVWKAGGAYIPLDIQYPWQRILEILNDSKAKVLMSMKLYETPQLVGGYRGGLIDVSAIECPGEHINLDPNTNMNSLAYVIYTSGSTGTPKGAMVEHIGMLNHILAKINSLRLTGNSVVVQNASHTFDISVWQFFSSLLLGARTLIYPETLILDFQKFVSRIVRDQVTILEVVPSYLSLLFDYLGNEKTLPLSLQYLLVTGEEVKPHLVRQWFARYPGIKMVNAYGPTEASDDITHYIMERVPDMEIIPIGRPLQNLKIYIVDPNMKLCPVGVKGEICVSGVGVGRGYLGDEKKTKQVFMEDPFTQKKGVRLYKTGDLGCWLPDGIIEFYGRKDYQVKIRGFRIELGEIENRLLNLPGVKETVVIVREERSGNKYLCAYIVSGKKYRILELRAFLAKGLPDYMIPSYFVQLERMPLTFNGKIDRRALPDPGKVAEGKKHNPPRDKLEAKLVEIFSRVLEIQGAISIDDNFFELGGHSLKAIMLLSKIHKELDIRIPLTEIFKKPTIRGLGKYIKRAESEKYYSIRPIEKKNYYTLSSAQKRLYILQKMKVGNIAYNMPAVIPLSLKCDLEKIEGIFKTLIKRHESFRTSFHMIDDEPLQRVHDHGELKIEYYDFVDAKRMSENINVLLLSIIKNFVSPFDLSKAPLLRVGLIKTGDESDILMVDMHHIISDGISLNILEEEFMSLYRGEESNPLRIRYKDFSQWQNDEEKKEYFKQQEIYWLKEYNGEIPVLDLPTDYPRPANQSFEGEFVDFELFLEEAKALEALALSEGITLFMLILAVFTVMLSKLSGQEDIIVGTPVAGRNHADLSRIIGMFVNTLALRNYPEGEKSFREFLYVLKERTLEAFENKDYQFEDLVDAVLLNRDATRNPLFDAKFTFETIDENSTGIPTGESPYVGGKEESPDSYGLGTSKCDLSLYAFKTDERLFFSFNYCKRLFKKETIDRLIRYYKKIVSSIVENPDITLSEIDIISEEERNRILYEFNNTAFQYQKDKTIQRLFEEQVERGGDRVAIIGITSLTYRELNEKSNRLAFSLQKKGVRPDTIVGIMVERSVEMIMGIFGILKAGGAYLPIDMNCSQERMNFMLKDSRARILLTNHILMEMSVQETHGSSQISINASPRPAIPSHLAYAIYKPGPGGKPKSVLIEHHSVSNRLNWMQRYYPITPQDVILQKNKITFDVSVWELFWWSFQGAALCLLNPGSERDPEPITDAVEKNRVTAIHFVPSMLDALLDYLETTGKGRKFIGLRYVFSSGEELKFIHVKRFHRLLKRRGETESPRLVNLYGVTESTANVSFFDCQEEDSHKRVPIGKPIDNVRLYIVAGSLKLQPTGICGELCIAGDGLARGYLNRPELTAEKFVDKENLGAKSQEPKAKLYKTGDLARWLPDGNIEFLGRSDHQVKIRGFGVEPAEIENQLLSYEEIKGAVVLAKEDDKENNFLCAYIVPKSPNGAKRIDVSELREFLSKLVPDYMIPSFFIQVEKIPLTSNGRVDKKALPEPEIKRGDGYVAPRNEVEKILVKTWSEVLGITRIGIDQSFFEIGGDSIKAIQISARLNKSGYKLEIKDIFSTPQISQLSPKVKKIERIGDQSIIEGIVPLTAVQKRFFEKHYVKPHHFNQAVILHSRGRLDEKAIKAVFIKIQEHHDALRMVYRQDSGAIIQMNRGSDYPCSLEVYDLRKNENAVETLLSRCDRIQAGIDLENGPLMKVGLFHLDDGDRLLIVVHHLVIDGVSWRILFEDIETLNQKYIKNEPLKLPDKTDSFKIWAEKLAQYANSKSFLKEKAYWSELQSKEIPELKKDLAGESNIKKDVETLSFELDESLTENLLKRTNVAFGTEITDILLTALSMALKKTFGHDRLLIALEGHGREGILPGIDISRTVGWFTTKYPVLLDISYENDLSRQIKEIKESLRRVPNNGIGYGLLKYMTAPEHKAEMNFKLKPQVILNYWGQFDAELRQMSSFEIAKESYGNDNSPGNQREYEFEVAGMIVNKRLSLSIFYNKTHYRSGTVDTLLNEFRDQLIRIIHFCSTRERKEFSPSDFTYPRLSIETVDNLQDQYSYSLEDIYPLTPMQEGMLFHSLYDQNQKKSSAYFEQFSYLFRGELNISLIEKSINALFHRYDILRTVFIHEGFDRPLQVVLPKRAVDFHFEDLRGVLAAPDEKEKYIREFKERNRQRGFDLSKDVLMRLAVLQSDESDYEFIWSHHHIVMDGWCIGILITEYLEIYDNYLENRTYQLPPVRPYRDYIKWLEKQDKEETRRYWSDYLEAYEELAAVPGINSFEGHEEDYIQGSIDWSPGIDFSKGLNRLANKNKVTLNVILQTIWGILLGRYNNKQDVVFGVVVSGRPSQIEGIESMVGLFINTIPIRIRFEEEMKFNSLSQNVQDIALESEPHHYYSLAKIQSGCSLKQNLLDHIWIFENFPVAEQVDGVINRDKGGDNKLKSEISNATVFEQTNYNFNVVIVSGDELKVSFEYNRNQYEKDFIERIANHFNRMVEQVLIKEDVCLAELSLLTDQERDQILYTFNKTETQYPREKTIDRLLEEQVERTPDNIALVGPSIGADSSFIQVSYREFNDKCGCLAHWLRQAGVKPDTAVGIILERSILMMISILGVLKAGGAYLPIDVNYPQERINYMLKDSGAKILLNHDLLDKARLNQFTRLTPPTGITQSHHLAYVMYTSGSTGKPKGVLVEHRNVNAYLNAFLDLFDITTRDTYLQQTAFTFDTFVEELYPTLIRGGKTAIFPGEAVTDIYELSDFFYKHDITAVSVTPFLLNEIDKMAHTASIRIFLSGGDVLKSEYMSRIIETKEVYNGYGPTETTVCGTFYKCLTAGNSSVPIGKPISNYRVYILDKFGKLLPIGIPGEICIGGDGVTRGYLNRPELTAEKFVDLRAKLYKTGDLGRWLPDGNIEYMGRKDNQIKIRGQRIEIREIEQQLLKHDAVRDTVVLAREDREAGSSKYLCAYVVLSDKELFEESSAMALYFRSYLSGVLPYHMVPSFFVKIDKIPLNNNGKVDRKALPYPAVQVERRYVAPHNEAEETLVKIWRDVLGNPKIGIHDNFFEIGGDSIKAIQIAARLKKSGYKIEIRDIFINPLISDLASKVKTLERIGDQSVIEGIVPLTPIQKHFFEYYRIEPHYFNQAVMLHSRERLDEEAIRVIFIKIQEHHDALRMVYRKDSRKIIQLNRGFEHPFSIEVYDFSKSENAVKALTSRCEQIQAGIDLESGPLMKVGLFHLDDGDRLLIVVHHLVIDGVSWRILFEDLETLYQQYKNNAPLNLPAKTDSFKHWSEKLIHYANSESFLKEKAYWIQLESKKIPGIRKELEEKSNIIKDVESLSFELAESDTETLLKRTNRAFGTEINDILLISWGMALKKIFGHDRFLIALEGHGREGIFEEMDISRTIGWFTTIFPVLLDVSYENDLPRQIKEIKEILHQIPNNGIGFGLLKYMTAQENKADMNFKLKPQISFNYLGQFDAELRQMSSFEIAKESQGNDSSPKSQREYEFDVSGIIVNKRLSISILYNRKHFRLETVEALLNEYQDELIHVIHFCSNREGRELSPSDFTYPGLSIETVDQLQNQYSYLIKNIYPLTPMQEGMLFHSLYNQNQKNSTMYFEQLSYRLHGELNILFVEKSLDELLKRHDVLQTVYGLEDRGRPLQVVLHQRPVDFYFEDLKGAMKNRDERERYTREFKERDRQRGFDLSKDVLMRISVLQLDELEYEFIWSHHHILMDGWCIGILIGEYLEIYDSFLENRAYRLPKVRPYRDYIKWLEKQDKEKTRRYWSDYLDGYDELSGVPRINALKGDEDEYIPASLEWSPGSDLSRGLNRLAIKNKVTLNVILQTIWGVLLGRYNNKQDVVFGVVVSGRPSQIEGIESMIGLFINTKPVRIRFEEKLKFNSLARNVQDMALESEFHHYYSLAEIQSDSILKQNLVDHIWVFENYPIAEQIDGTMNRSKGDDNKWQLDVSDVAVYGQSNYDFNVVIEDRDEITVRFKYNENQYQEEVVERIAKHFKRVSEQVLMNEEVYIEELSLLTDQEKDQLLNLFNAEKVKYPRDKSLHQLFEEQEEKTPDHAAVVGPITNHKSQVTNQVEMHISYRELNEKSNRLAHRLQAKGIKPDSIVSLIVNRSIGMVIGIIAILKAGGAYFPIEPNCPKDRINFMLADSSAEILMTTRALSGKTTFAKEIIYLECQYDPYASSDSNANLPPAACPSNIAYIIYTSGTTGNPKGVIIEHENVVRLMVNDKFQFDFSESDVWSMFHSYCFDFSVWEMYGALLYGGKLFIVPEMVSRDTWEFLELLKKQSVTVLNQTPSAFYNLINLELNPSSCALNNKLLNIRYVIFGGEALTPAKLKVWHNRYPKTRLINMYGISETTVHVTYKEIEDNEIDINLSCIGRPIPTLSTYVMDKNLKLQPLGVPGELLVGGKGVGRGYLNRPGLTREKFVDHPYRVGERLYKSGDLVRLMSEGELEYLGRIDQQVKIRGFRIELGEIENQLLDFAPVKEVVVVDNKDNSGDKRLTAYIVPHPEHAYPVQRLLELKRQGGLSDHQLYELPSGHTLFYINRSETDSMYREIFEDQSYLRHGIKLSEGACIFDVGANIGVFSLFAHHTCKDAKIYSFEPIPPIYEVLELNTSLYGGDVKLFQCGISSVSGEAFFTYYPLNTVLSGRYADTEQEMKTVKAFIDNQQLMNKANDKDSASGDQVQELLEDRLPSLRFKCVLKTLSQIIEEDRIERIDLLKIDVEKSEIDVLLGIAEKDWPKIEQMVIDVHNIDGRLDKIIELLENHGYKVSADQDRLLDNTDLYNVYAVQPGKDEVTEENSDRLGERSESSSYCSPERLKSDAHNFLRARLPEYMIPSMFVLLEAIPLTSSHKIDRKALLSIETDEIGKEYTAPTDEVEKKLAEIWSEVLGIEKDIIGIDADFFELGGHSLKATIMAGRIHKTLNVRMPLTVVFQTPTIRGLARYIKGTVKDRYASIKPAEKKHYYPLSASQNRLYFIQQLSPGSTSYNLPQIVGLEGTLDYERLGDTFYKLITRHESFRTSFETVDGWPVQRVCATVPFTLQYYDLENRESRQGESRNEDGIVKGFIKPFDLSKSPLIRVGIIKLEKKKHILMVDMHHIITDGISMNILSRCFMDLYAGENLSPLKLQYKDFSEWENKTTQKEVMIKQEEYWLKELSGELPVLELPTDFSTPERLNYESGSYSFEIDEKETRALRELALREGATMHILLLTIYTVLLAKLSDQEDIIVGMAVAGRRHADLENIIGMFLNMLAIRNYPGGEKTFNEFLREVIHRTLHAYDNQDYQFDDLMDKLKGNVTGGMNRNPLFNAAFGLQNMDTEEIDIPGLKLVPYEFELSASKIDILMIGVETGENLSLLIEYNSGLFKKETIEHYSIFFKRIVIDVIENPDIRLNEINVLTGEEINGILVEKKKNQEAVRIDFDI